MARRALPRRPLRRRRGGSGFSLIEMLVVIVLFSFGLLGLVALQARATQFSVAAEDSTRAALLASEIASAMWSQKTVTLPGTTLASWNTRVGSPTSGGLPNGQGEVSVTGKVARITVRWRPPHEADATRWYSYVTEVVMP